MHACRLLMQVCCAYLWKSMQQKHQWLGPLSHRHAVELDTIGGDVLVSTKLWIGQACGWHVSLAALEGLDRVPNDIPDHSKHRQSAPKNREKSYKQLETDCIHGVFKDLRPLPGRTAELERYPP